MSPTPDTTASAVTEALGERNPAGADAELAEGTRIGAFRILRALGEGGMGQVYLAEQTTPVQREVALKLIRQQIAGPIAQAWFEVERQALAQMQHPAIAQIFDAGTTPQGHPYMAMEYVDGTPLLDFARRHGLDRAARLALFVRVCHGVQHAHQKGIIHRDLKPDNVLVTEVDGAPAPKIIDFGIAVGGRADGEGGRVTASGTDRAGTAIYMSPEQASNEAGGIDTRSDVYALGVMLCELLTDASAGQLCTPGVAETAEIRQTLATLQLTEPPEDHGAQKQKPLIDAARNLPRELRAILGKALALDRADRYESASALADDLERHLGQRPVRALPPTRLYQVSCFVRRHRLGLVALTLVIVALVAGVAMAVHGMTRARVEAAKAERISEFVRTILAGIDPDRAQGMDTKLMHTLLDTAAERVGRELRGQADVRAEIERTIADSYASLGDFERAERHYSAAIEASRAAGFDAGQVARMQVRAAITRSNAGDRDAAKELIRAAQASIAGQPVDDGDRLRVESLAASFDAESGQLESAAQRLRQILATQRRLLGNDDPDTLDTISSLADVDRSINNLDEASRLFEELANHWMTQRGPEYSQTLAARNGMAIVALEQKRFAEAEAILTPMLAITERVFGREHPRTLSITSNLAGAIRQQGRSVEARPYYERAVNVSRKLFGEESTSTVIAESNLSLLLRDVGELDAAVATARQAAKGADKIWASNGMRGIMHREFGSILLAAGHYAEAEAELDRAWNIFVESEGFGAEHPRAQDVVSSALELYQKWPHADREAAWQARRRSEPANTP